MAPMSDSPSMPSFSFGAARRFQYQARVAGGSCSRRLDFEEQQQRTAPFGVFLDIGELGDLPGESGPGIWNAAWGTQHTLQTPQRRTSKDQAPFFSSDWEEGKGQDLALAGGAAEPSWGRNPDMSTRRHRDLTQQNQAKVLAQKLSPSPPRPAFVLAKYPHRVESPAPAGTAPPCYSPAATTGGPATQCYSPAASSRREQAGPSPPRSRPPAGTYRQLEERFFQGECW